MKPIKQSSKKKIFLIAVFIFLPALLITTYYLLLPVYFTSAFTGPSTSAGIGNGAIGVNSSNNLSIGTSTPTAETKFLIFASSTDTSNFSLKIIRPGVGGGAGYPVFVVRNDGSIGIGTSSPAYTLDVAGDVRITGTLTANLNTSVNASNVTAGVFGAGNFAFPSSLGIATSSQVGLPQSLSVYGGGYFVSSVGVGTTAPVQFNGSSTVSTLLDVSGPNGGGVTAHTTPVGTYGEFSFTKISGGSFIDSAGATNLASNDIIFRTGRTASNFAVTEAMRIQNDGNVGIGAANPSRLLHLDAASGRTPIVRFSTAGTFRGDIGISGGSGTSFTIFANDAINTLGIRGDAGINLGAGGVINLAIASSGNVGIGTTAPGAKLEISGQYFSTKFALTDGPTIALDWANSNVQSVTLGGNRTFTFASPRNGAVYTLLLTQDNTGSRTVTWPATVKWPGGVAPVLTSTAGALDILTFVSDGTNYNNIGFASDVK